jgi:hypothetical protein
MLRAKHPAILTKAFIKNNLRNMRLRKSNTFYCFSPPVMIATFLIEMSFALYAIWRYQLNKLTRLLVATLVFLAIFQFIEYFVCTTGNSYGGILSRVGYISITMLPPLGIHIIATLKKFRYDKQLVVAAYASAALFISWFLFFSSSLTSHVCQGNYVIFHVKQGAVLLYALYYYGFVIGGLLLSAILASKTTKSKTKQALYGMSLGYAGFIVPTTTANILDSSTIAGIPSIMCGFAVILALVIVLIVLPNAGTLRKR